MVIGPDQVAEQERIASALVGHCLTRVTYFSLDVEGENQPWDSPGGDAVDFGVDLDFDGHPLSVGWMPPTGDSEGLHVANGSLLAWRNLDAKRDDVPDSSRWLPALGARLTAVRLDWRPWLPGSSTSYLVGIHFSFGGKQKVTIAMAELAAGQIVRSATNIAVIFDDVAVP